MTSMAAPVVPAVRIVGNEVRKGLLHAWAERVQILIELPLFIGVTLLLGPLLGAGDQIARGQLRWSLDSGRMSILVVWMVPFLFFYLQVAKMFWRLLGEIQSGTLEQVYLSPLPSWLIAAAGRLVAALAETAVIVAALYAGVGLLVPLHIGRRPAAALPLLLVIAVVGYSLLIGGLTLVWKRIEMLVEAQGIAVWVLSATALPLLAVPGWMATAGRLVPITPGLASLDRLLLASHPAITLWGTGGLAWMLATAAGWLLAGILAFALGERAAKRRGSLGRY
jgi:ABC-2 type transport system permease protein